MVAIVAGPGLGLERSSGFVLGGLGTLGQAGTGRAFDNVYVNAANGNLVVQQTDEMLIGDGPDAGFGRTYNLQPGSQWQHNTSRRVTTLTGTVNTAGSTVTHVDWDGSEVVFAYDVARSAYVANENGGAYETLSFAGSTWTWTDGDSRTVDLYDHANGGRITSRRDTDGNALVFTYVGTLLDKVTTQDGSYTSFIYTSGKLSKLETNYKDQTQTWKKATRVYYSYDGGGRISKVEVDLTPEDNSKADGKVYTTYYTYSSGRITTITQSDGSKVDFVYTLLDGVYRVTRTTVTAATGVTRATNISYDFVNRITTVKDPFNQETKLAYDAAGRLISVMTPPPVSGAPQAVTS